MKNKILKVVGGFLAVVGFVFIVGSVGAFEYDNITFLQMIVEILLGVGGCYLGVVCIASSGEVDNEF